MRYKNLAYSAAKLLENAYAGYQELEIEYVTNRAGEKSAVIVPIANFEELLEDIEDLATAAERRDEPTITHDQLLTELKRDGLI